MFIGVMMMKNFTLSRKRTFYNYLLITGIILSSIFTGCTEEKPHTTHIRGKIINPKVDYIIVTDHDQLNDTLPLDERGVFAAAYEGITSGLYSISYPGEYQSFYLEQGDSLSLRANTKAFDETLAFDGSHAKENNFLINLFTDIENGNMALLDIKSKSPKLFYDKVVEIKEMRLEKLRKVGSKNKFEERFMDFAQFIIKLNSYYELERYPLVRKKNLYMDPSFQFPDGFFSHRERVDLDMPKLLNNYAYRPYVNALVSNLAYKKATLKNPNEKINFKGYSYNMERLKVIDSIFDDQELLNIFAAGEIRNFIRSRKSAEEINQLVEDFLDISKDQTTNEEIAQMAATYMDLEPGSKLPNFELRDVENRKMKLSSHVDQLTVLYYWSIQDRDYALGIHDQVMDLQIKYPEIEFIGINIDDVNYDTWQDAIANNNFRNSKEYQLYDKSVINRQLALRNSNRSMVIGKNLTIIDPNINLFYYKIETTLLGYINK